MLQLLLVVAAAAAPMPPPGLTQIEARVSVSVTARRLLSVAAEVPRREAHESGLPLAIDVRGTEHPEIVIDLERIGDLPTGEPEAQYARALSRAAIAAPIALIEAEQAARQWAAQILVEAAVGDVELSRALRAAEMAPVIAAPELSRCAQFLTRFEKDPEAAWWVIENGGVAPREAVRLTAVEDLFALRAAAIRALTAPPEGPYVELGGRRYLGSLARAAYRLRAPGAIEAARESLGAFDTIGVPSLRYALIQWRQIPPSRP